ncbi:MAG: histidine kinase N-terminal 7TM domain-containing protein [Halobacteriales archaeon]
MEIFGQSVAYVAYVLAYGLAAAGCLAGLRRAVRIEDPETRRGLAGLVAVSAGWATFELGLLLAPTPRLRYVSYLLSLIVGLAAIGAWLYFCSAYTGRSFHQVPAFRRTALGLYLGIVIVKLTNPWHGLYFTTEFVGTPFPHLTVQHGTIHWVVSGLSYALVAVGFFMLYELFLEADYDTRPLGLLAAVTAVPVVLDVVGFASPLLLDLNYEPLGVAVFAVGTLYVFDEEFLAVQLTDGVDEAVVYLDDDGRIREFNDRAAGFLPLAGTRGEPLASAHPDVAARLDEAEPILEREVEGERRYYLVSDTAFSLGQVDIGGMVMLTDVTETERRRRELERQNEQLEGFASAIRHELLNTLNIVRGKVSIAGEELDEGDVETARDSLRGASEASERMTRIVDDLARLARHGQSIEETEWIDLEDAAESAWAAAGHEGTELSIEGSERIEADPERLGDLFESAFTFAAHNGAETVTVSPREDGFAITDGGESPNGVEPEAYFEYGRAVPDEAAGMTLPNVRTLARVHGWRAEMDTEYDDGVRVVVSGASVR